MGEMMEPFVVAMVATFNGTIVNYPVYLIKPEKVDEFKERFDNTQPGLVWFMLDNVNDLRGPFPHYQLGETCSQHLLQ